MELKKRKRKTPVLPKRKPNSKVIELARKALDQRSEHHARSYLRGLAQIDPKGATSRAIRRMTP